MVVLTREQLEDRLAALHQASLELVRNLSLDTVLERIVHFAREQVGAEFALLGLLDDEGNLKKFVQVGMTEEEVAQIPNPPRGKGLIGALKTERRTIRLPDISEDPRSVGFPENHLVMRSFLGVPIMQGERLFGQLYLTNKLGWHQFTENDERVIETLAAYAANAISNARLYEGILMRDQVLIQRNEDLALLNDAASALSGSLEVSEILDRTLSRVMAYLDVEAGEILLREDDSETLRLALHLGEAPEAFWSQDYFKVGECLIGDVALNGRVKATSELAQDICSVRLSVVKAGFKSMICIPLSAQKNKVVGVLSLLTRKKREFDVREINLLSAIGVWAGTAIENAWLHRQTRRLAVLEERERIGMDLHDGIIQSIYAVGLALDFARGTIYENPEQSLEKIEQAIEGLNSSIRDLRAYILDLRPRQFNEAESLMRGLERLADEFRANSTTEMFLSGHEGILNNLPLDNSMALFHICQEALANVAKHSKAGRVDTSLWATEDRVLLEVSDDGHGFDLTKMSTTLGHGLSNMHRRARKVGGDIEITSAPGEGTTVLAWVPRYL